MGGGGHILSWGGYSQNIRWDLSCSGENIVEITCGARCREDVIEIGGGIYLLVKMLSRFEVEHIFWGGGYQSQRWGTSCGEDIIAVRVVTVILWG